MPNFVSWRVTLVVFVMGAMLFGANAGVFAGLNYTITAVGGPGVAFVNAVGTNASGEAVGSFGPSTSDYQWVRGSCRGGRKRLW